VLDGRDIGTVICPDADVKIFVIAAPEVRARRRAAELAAAGQSANEAEILEDIRRRDERDRSRAVAPLKAAADAMELDTSNLDVEAAVAAAIRIIEGAVRSRERRA
jgi:cytidylate kinase